MRGKITLDFAIPRTNYKDLRQLAEKAFQVAYVTLVYLDEIDFEGRVEIIKITWKTKEIWEQRNEILGVDFQMGFVPFLWGPWQEELKMVASWHVGGKTVSIHKYDEEKKRAGNYISGISLANDDINSLAKALIQAMRVIIQEREPFFSRATEKLTEVDAQLAASLDKLNIEVRA